MAMTIITQLDLQQEKKFEIYRADCLVAAEELYYGEDVLQKIRECKTEPELIRIMINARHAMSDPIPSRKLQLVL